ncbi:insulinase family protein [Patescibacteria group bacterium]|nr:insulinase family protein [Patescibacteria group bacterium]
MKKSVQSMLDFSKVELDSGLTVLRIPMPAVASVTALVLGNTGSRYETKAQQGIAHFFEHMVFKGTKNYPTAQKLAGAVDVMGAEFNAFTGREYTGYYVKSASQHLAKALDVLSDMMLEPNLKQADIDREKGVIIEEMNMYHDTPMQYVDVLFNQLMFEDTGLGHNIIGTKETVSAFSKGDFEKFLHEWYGLDNLMLVIAGHAKVVNHPATLVSIEQAFAKNCQDRLANQISSRDWIQQHQPQPVLGQKRLVVDSRQIEQAHLSLGWPGLKVSDKRRYVLSVLAVVLGGNMSSRLFSEVREKRGLCYYVRSETDFNHDTGVFGASAGVDPARVHEALEVIIQLFKDLASGQQAVTAEELNLAKEFSIGSLVLSLEDSRGVGQFYGMKQLLLQSVHSPEEVMNMIRSVSIDQVQELAKELIKERELRLAIIGPFENRADFDKYTSAGHPRTSTCHSRD